MSFAQSRPIVIAHRGASGYLPEHTLAAKALAFGMGADYLEQDVVLTRDDHPIVLHDIHLDTVTDVAQQFPGRQRADGRFYALDFTLAEIKGLRVTERVQLESRQAVFPGRFPAGQSAFTIPTLMEEIEFVQGMTQAVGRDAGIYPEIKSPAWHRSEGHDISRIVIDVLNKYGFRDRSDPIHLQCFDIAELKRIRMELGCELKLVQLIGGDDRHDRLRTAAGLAELARYVDGIGPRIEHLVTRRGDDGRITPNALVREAHGQGLVVHPYTFRSDSLPAGVRSTTELLELLFRDLEVDGVFTDFPDTVVDFLRDH
jgi:glycerophosphoryl diester phosphodiesterase